MIVVAASLSVAITLRVIGGSFSFFKKLSAPTWRQVLQRCRTKPQKHRGHPEETVGPLIRASRPALSGGATSPEGRNRRLTIQAPKNSGAVQRKQVGPPSSRHYHEPAKSCRTRLRAWAKFIR
jgi:hypothetical protein